MESTNKATPATKSISEEDVPIMIRHLVLWKLLDEAEGKSKEENIKIIEAKFAALAGRIEGLESVKVYKSFASSDFDICLDCVLSSKAALEVYQKHPLHEEARIFVRKVISARTFFDTEVDA